MIFFVKPMGARHIIGRKQWRNGQRGPAQADICLAGVIGGAIGSNVIGENNLRCEPFCSVLYLELCDS
jgi:hypothetical protein